MTITLHQVVPAPIREKALSGMSDIWNRELVLRAGDHIKVKAPSGSGKTTLTHIIWNLRRDYDGTVAYDGVNVLDIPAEAMAQYRQEKLSVVFQDLRLFGQITALENIELKRNMPGKPYCSLEKVQAMAAQLGVAHVLGQQTSTCSYGEQQRIAIIRALVQPFTFLIMDEPFSHLDRDNARKAAGLIAAECRDRGAGFLVTDLDDDDLFDYSVHLNL
ncbi:MAG: ATP-binding cassette domain-containing protein [Chitinophagaceae bacterium]|jgi:putative ABC transport system ATP-binding protein|nr:ATP-binding cassette domain-containing protein [Chitinophagaceae bacterium]